MRFHIKPKWFEYDTWLENIFHINCLILSVAMDEYFNVGEYYISKSIRLTLTFWLSSR